MNRGVLLCLILGLIVGGEAVRRQRKISTKAASQFVNCGCQCSSLTFRDKYGRVQGNCKRADHTGAQWCYVSGWNSPCKDLSRSKRFSKPWSYEACATPPLNQCNSFGGIGGGGGYGGNPSPSTSNYCVRPQDCKGQIFDGEWVCRNNKCQVRPLCLYGNCNSGGSGGGGFGGSGGSTCGRNGCGGSGSGGGYGGSGGSTCGRNGCGGSGTGSGGGYGGSGGSTCGRNGCGGSGTGGGSSGGSTCGRNGCGGSGTSGGYSGGSSGTTGSTGGSTQCRGKRCFGQLSQILGNRRGNQKG